MPYTILDNFAKGLDLRRPEVGQLAGSFSIGENVHVSRGGTVQKRKGLIAKYALPFGLTHGLAQAGGTLYAFGHADPGVVTMPVGVLYQQLSHPSGEALTKVLSVDNFDGKLYVAGLFTDGSVYQFYDGAVVTDLADGRARGIFQITGGSASAGVNKITSVKVDGIEVLSTPIDWTTSHAATAALVAAAINAYVSAPNYTSASQNAFVYVIHPTAGSTYNGLNITVTAAGDVTIATPSALDGGVAGAVETGRYVKTFKRKLYTTAASLAFFSGINAPTKFNSSAVGAGAINMSNHGGGSEELIAIVEFLGLLAFFARDAAQIWSLDADPEQNALVQNVGQIGLEAPRAAIPFGEADVAFLSASGVRSLRPSESAAGLYNTVSLSGAIDKLLVAQLISLAPAVVSDAIFITEPRDGRLWVSLGSTVYVLSYFPDLEITAWSTYDFGFAIDDMLVMNRQLYVRSGNTVYLYGGDTGLEFDACVPTLRLPNITAAAPATYKGFHGIDFGIVGEWTVDIEQNLYDTIVERVAVVNRASYDAPDIPIVGETTHLTVILTGRAVAEEAEIVNVGLHFHRHEAG